MTNRQNGPLLAADRRVTVDARAMQDWVSGTAAPQDRSALRLATAERVITEAFAGSRRAVDRDAIDAAFAAARDCLAEAKELSRRAHVELAMARRERYQAQRERDIDRQDRSARRSKACGPIVADAPGVRFCPDPQSVGTDAELMNALRTFWMWTGRPSYRIMAQQCGNRYAASTLHGALRSDKLPSLDMLLAIVIGCRGTAEHQQAFASAWRQLKMPNLATGRAETETWILRPVRDTA